MIDTTFEQLRSACRALLSPEEIRQIERAAMLQAIEELNEEISQGRRAQPQSLGRADGGAPTKGAEGTGEAAADDAGGGNQANAVASAR